MDVTESSPLQTESSPETGRRRNIIIFCDGTGNEFIANPADDKSNSNVVKIYTAMDSNQEQVAYYHPGLGTAGDPAARTWVAKKWSVVKGLAFGWGFKENVMDAYRYLMENYKDDDRVYMFGFSRGSYTVRALAGLLHGYGLLHQGNDGHLPYAWNAYVDQHNDRKRHHVVPNERFKQTFSRPGFRIHFMGIFDTVSSVGWVNTPLRLYSVAENPIIDIGRHAVSIDERRCFFRDNLWVGGDASKLTKAPIDEQKKTKQDLLQIWFAGVHSDVGGSYLQKESVLSNIALDWLIREAKKAHALTNNKRHALVLGETDLPDDDTEADQSARAETDGEFAELPALYPKPTISKVHKSLRGAWWLLELLPHRYYDKDNGQENWRTPLGMRRRIPRGSFIHKSVRERLEGETYKYKPSNLSGGPNALKPIEVLGQKSGSVYVYEPLTDKQPLLNQAPVRIGVMVLVSALELAALAFGALWLWRHR